VSFQNNTGTHQLNIFNNLHLIFFVRGEFTDKVQYANILKGDKLTGFLSKEESKKKTILINFILSLPPLQQLCWQLFCLLPAYLLLPPPSCGITQIHIFIADLLRGGTRIKETK
jgi:hypothetical protein